jgi:hypothetical protein
MPVSLPVSSGTSGWSLEALKVYFDSLRAADDARYTERFQTKQRADEQQARDLTTRLAGVNEFRQTLSDQAGTFVTRETVQAMVAGLESKIEGIDRRVTTNEGRNLGQSNVIGYIVGAAGVGAAILSHFWK